MMDKDLNNYIMFGEGNSAFTYFHKNDKSIILKLFKPFISYDVANMEYQMAKHVYNLGVNTPKVFDFDKINDCYAITYEQILNKKSLARLISEDFANVDKYISIFVEEAKLLHSIKVEDDFFVNRNKLMINIINRAKYLNDEEKQYMINFYSNLKDDNYCIHGDFHTGNIITNFAHNYFIDLGFFGRGDPLFDVGTFYALMKIVADSQRAQETFHLSEKQLNQCWDIFAKKYFNVKDDELENVNNKIKPYGISFFIYVMDQWGENKKDIEHIKAIINELRGL